MCMERGVGRMCAVDDVFRLSSPSTNYDSPPERKLSLIAQRQNAHEYSYASKNLRMSNEATRSASSRESIAAQWARQTNLPRTGNNSSPCCKPTYDQDPRSGWPPAAGTCTAMSREAAEC